MCSYTWQRIYWIYVFLWLPTTFHQHSMLLYVTFNLPISRTAFVLLQSHRDAIIFNIKDNMEQKQQQQIITRSRLECFSSNKKANNQCSTMILAALSNLWQYNKREKIRRQIQNQIVYNPHISRERERINNAPLWFFGLKLNCWFFYFRSWVFQIQPIT